MMKYLSGLFFLVLANTAFAEIQHHDFVVSSCRQFQSNAFQLAGTSITHGGERLILVDISNQISADRSFSICLSALVTQKPLRLDYLECNGSNCVMTPNSSIALKK